MHANEISRETAEQSIKAAREANGISREIAQAELRAYVAVDHRIVIRYQDVFRQNQTDDRIFEP